MKRTIIAILICLPLMAFGKDYYTGKKTVKADGVTFVVEGNLVRNAANKLYLQPSKMSDGTVFYAKDWAFHYECLNWDIVEQIVKSNISSSILKKMKKGDCHLIIGVDLIPSTGRVAEVDFILTNDGKNKINEAFAIPPKSLAVIEKEIKAKIRYKCSMTNIDYVSNFLYCSGSRGNCTSNIK